MKHSPEKTKLAVLNAGLTSDTPPVSAQKQRKKKPNGKECPGCREKQIYIKALEADQKFSWDEIKRLNALCLKHGIAIVEEENGDSNQMQDMWG